MPTSKVFSSGLSTSAVSGPIKVGTDGVRVDMVKAAGEAGKALAKNLAPAVPSVEINDKGTVKTALSKEFGASGAKGKVSGFIKSDGNVGAEISMQKGNVEGKLTGALNVPNLVDHASTVAHNAGEAFVDAAQNGGCGEKGCL